MVIDRFLHGGIDINAEYFDSIEIRDFLGISILYR